MDKRNGERGRLIDTVSCPRFILSQPASLSILLWGWQMTNEKNSVIMIPTEPVFYTDDHNKEMLIENRYYQAWRSELSLE